MFSIKTDSIAGLLFGDNFVDFDKIRSKSKYQSDDETRKLVYEWRFSQKKNWI